MLCTPHACMHPSTQARAYCPCILCTPHACTHLPKPVHAVHATCMHPFTQARACCARHMHAPIYLSPCILCTPLACTHLPKHVHTVYATCMHPFTQARACCARDMHAPIYRSSRMGCTPVARTHSAWLNSELPIRGAPGSRRGLRVPCEIKPESWGPRVGECMWRAQHARMHVACAAACTDLG